MGKLNETFLNTTEAAQFLKVSPRTIEKWRITGEGPEFLRLGRRRVVYRPEDLESWAETGRCRSIWGDNN